MEDFYVLEPEVAGGLGPETVMNRGSHPPDVSSLHYEFSGWLGDEIVESFPCYLVTKGLASRIANCGMSGMRFDSVKVTRSAEFEELDPNRSLPEFIWLRPEGVAGRDDFGIGLDHRLVVSARALEQIRSGNPRGLIVEPFIG